jgi:hypothetical protein
VRGTDRWIALEDRRDELDRLVDDAFAGIPDAPPGRVDAVLGLGGVAFVALAVAGAGGAWLALGFVLLALGGARPLSHVVRVASERRRSRLAHPVEEGADAGR